MSIGFVIVTFNSEGVLPACLGSIPEGCEIAVVDNASEDNSTQIAAAFGARVIVNDRNRGFGPACNQGARLVSPSHIFFLNPDAVLAPGTLDEIEKAIALYPDAGGFGPAIRVAGKRQKFHTTSYPQRRGQRATEVPPPAANAEVDFLDGAALVVDRKLFWQLGGFDERIFLYYDDDDLCFRIRSQRRKLIYVPSACMFHQRNGSSGSSIHLDYFRTFHATKSKIYISHKYGIPVDDGREKTRAVAAFLRSILLLNVRKAARALGVLFALHSVPKPPVIPPLEQPLRS